MKLKLWHFGKHAAAPLCRYSLHSACKCWSKILFQAILRLRLTTEGCKFKHCCLFPHISVWCSHKWSWTGKAIIDHEYLWFLKMEACFVHASVKIFFCLFNRSILLPTSLPAAVLLTHSPVPHSSLALGSSLLRKNTSSDWRTSSTQFTRAHIETSVQSAYVSVAEDAFSHPLPQL